MHRKIRARWFVQLFAPGVLPVAVCVFPVTIMVPLLPLAAVSGLIEKIRLHADLKPIGGHRYVVYACRGETGLRAIDLENRGKETRIGDGVNLGAAILRSNGSVFVASGREIHEFSLPAPAAKRTIPIGMDTIALSLSSDETRLGVVSNAGVKIVNVLNGKTEYEVQRDRGRSGESDAEISAALSRMWERGAIALVDRGVAVDLESGETVGIEDLPIATRAGASLHVAVRREGNFVDPPSYVVARAGKPVWQKDLPYLVSEVRLSSDGKYLSYATVPGRTRLVVEEIDSGETRRIEPSCESPFLVNIH
ncbi:MAG: hypothetical protein HY897_12020 [Deltaproteobacteria bacterium]|nr:hypothetical protein [Deltaproteobacteria bacterium]